MKKLFFILLPVTVFLFPGCGFMELVRPGESPVERLERQCHILQAELENVKQKTDRQHEDLRTAYAEVKALLNGARSEVQSLRGEQEQTAYSLECHLQEFEAWRRKMESAVAKETRPPAPPMAVEPPAPVDTGPAETVTETPSGRDEAEAEAEAVAEDAVTDEDTFYQTGRELFDAGDYVGARDVFDQFVKRFPASQQADNAYFWIGETHYREGRYEKAILTYQEVVDKFPDGNKVPAALLKQGMAFYKISDDINARLVLKRLVREYPASPEAGNAGQMLTE